MPQASRISASVGSMRLGTANGWHPYHDLTLSDAPSSSSTLRPSSESRARKACGMPFRPSRSLTAYARPLCWGATTTTSRKVRRLTP